MLIVMHKHKLLFLLRLYDHIPDIPMVASEVLEQQSVSVTHSKTGNLKQIHPSSALPAESQCSTQNSEKAETVSSRHLERKSTAAAAQHNNYTQDS